MYVVVVVILKKLEFVVKLILIGGLKLRLVKVNEVFFVFVEVFGFVVVIMLFVKG